MEPVQQETVGNQELQQELSALRQQQTAWNVFTLDEIRKKDDSLLSRRSQIVREGLICVSILAIGEEDAVTGKEAKYEWVRYAVSWEAGGRAPVLGDIKQFD